MHVLRDLAAKVNADARIAAVRLEVAEELEQGIGVRQRLDGSRTVGYWPRIIVTDADRDDDMCPPECFEKLCPPECYEDPCECEDSEKAAAAAPKQPAWLRRRLALADRLKFVHVGQRARAETIVQQRQPGLVESLVTQAIQDKTYRPDFCRTLFQLLVPHDFKDAARQLDRIVLVVDGYTANFPWELMLAEKDPLAVLRADDPPTVVDQVSPPGASISPAARLRGRQSINGKFLQMFPTPNRKPPTAWCR